MDARELLSALTLLEAHQRANPVGALDLPAVQALLAETIARKSVPASLEGIANFVADRTGTQVEHLRGRSRKPGVVRARHMAMALARGLTGLTLREVGEYFGGRSCASVHAAQQKATELRESDPSFHTLWGEAGRRFQSTATEAS
jgi:chromosomal replication initiator protein